MNFKDSPAWLRRVSLWHEDGRPGACGLERVGKGDGFPWFELVCGVGETAEVFEVLRDHCPGLTEVMLEDLLTPDDLPDGKHYGNASIQLASTFGVTAERGEEEAPAERGTPGGSEKVAEGPAGSADAAVAPRCSGCGPGVSADRPAGEPRGRRPTFPKLLPDLPHLHRTGVPHAPDQCLRRPRVGPAPCLARDRAA